MTAKIELNQEALKQALDKAEAMLHDGYIDGLSANDMIDDVIKGSIQRYLAALPKAEGVTAKESWLDDEKNAIYADEIAAVHPTVTGDHTTYTEAMDLIKDRRSKYALVDLINWLLVKNKPKAKAAQGNEGLFEAVKYWYDTRQAFLDAENKISNPNWRELLNACSKGEHQLAKAYLRPSGSEK